MPDPLDYQIVGALRRAGHFTPDADGAQRAIERVRQQLEEQMSTATRGWDLSRSPAVPGRLWTRRLRWPALSALTVASSLLLVWLVADFSRTSIALADVTRVLQSLRSVRYTTSIDKGQGLAILSRTVISGRNLRRSEYVDGHVFALDRVSGHSLQLFPDKKRAIVRFDGVPHEDLFDVVDSLERERQVSRTLPEQLVNGKPAIGLVLEHENVEHVIWVEPRSRLLVRWESTIRGQDRKVTRYVHADFSYNEPVTAALFDLTPPSDYRVEQEGALELAPLTNEALQSPTLFVTKGIGPATFGMPREEVLRVFGPPDEIDERLQVYHYPSRGIDLMIAPGRGLWGIICRTQDVPAVKTRDYSGRTDAGIGMCATAEEIIAAYGAPDERVGSATGETLSYKGQHLHFSLHKGALVFIQHEWFIKSAAKRE